MSFRIPLPLVAFLAVLGIIAYLLISSGLKRHAWREIAPLWLSLLSGLLLLLMLLVQSEVIRLGSAHTFTLIALFVCAVVLSVFSVFLGIQNAGWMAKTGLILALLSLVYEIGVLVLIGAFLWGPHTGRYW
jgi:hypothetical protein